MCLMPSARPATQWVRQQVATVSHLTPYIPCIDMSDAPRRCTATGFETRWG